MRINSQERLAWQAPMSTGLLEYQKDLLQKKLDFAILITEKHGGNGCYPGWHHWNGSGSWMICVSGSERLREIDKCVVFLLTAPLLLGTPHLTPVCTVAFSGELCSNITRVFSLLRGTWCWWHRCELAVQGLHTNWSLLPSAAKPGLLAVKLKREGCLISFGDKWEKKINFSKSSLTPLMCVL